MECAYCEEPIKGHPVIREGLSFCSLECARLAIVDEPDDYDRLMADLSASSAKDSGDSNDDDDSATDE